MSDSTLVTVNKNVTHILKYPGGTLTIGMVVMPWGARFLSWLMFGGRSSIATGTEKQTEILSSCITSAQPFEFDIVLRDRRWTRAHSFS